MMIIIRAFMDQNARTAAAAIAKMKNAGSTEIIQFVKGESVQKLLLANLLPSGNHV